MRDFTPDRRDWLRLVGGMMIASGALVLLIRKQAEWSNWATFFVLLVPAVLLFVLALPAARSRWGLQGWQSAYLVFGTLLLLAALLQLVTALHGTPRDSLNLLWTFGVTAVVAVWTSLNLGVRFEMLVGAVAGVVVWLALWDKILNNPSGNTVRWLLVLLAVIYLAAAFTLARAGRPQASDLITISGLAAVLAALLSFAAAATAATAGGSLTSSLTGSAPKPGQGWNVFLLLVSLALIAYASRAATRGPGYVGALGLAGFILLTGTDLVTRLNGDPGGGVVGWPLVLLIGGAIAVALGFVLNPGALGGPGGPGRAGGPGGAAGSPTQTWPARAGASAPPAGQPGVVAPPPGQPGVAPPPPQPGAPPAPGQPNSLLDQWRQQPPPGAGPPPPQQ